MVEPVPSWSPDVPRRQPYQHALRPFEGIGRVPGLGTPTGLSPRVLDLSLSRAWVDILSGKIRVCILARLPKIPHRLRVYPG